MLSLWIISLGKILNSKIIKLNKNLNILWLLICIVTSFQKNSLKKRIVLMLFPQKVYWINSILVSTGYSFLKLIWEK